MLISTNKNLERSSFVSTLLLWKWKFIMLLVEKRCNLCNTMWGYDFILLLILSVKLCSIKQKWSKLRCTLTRPFIYSMKIEELVYNFGKSICYQPAKLHTRFIVHMKLCRCYVFMGKQNFGNGIIKCQVNSTPSLFFQCSLGSIYVLCWHNKYGYEYSFVDEVSIFITLSTFIIFSAANTPSE